MSQSDAPYPHDRGLYQKQENPTPSVDDPWRHRASNMRCVTCMWFVVKDHPNTILPPEGPLGRCRRHAPTLGGYPAVFAQDWCGDHKLR